MVDVSIIIVCMNKPENLRVCLESIKKYTGVSYEVLVVAYLFSKENLSTMKSVFPWACFIESDEIRGFSENNNIALRQAKGKYCFVLNDDTEMNMPVVDMLFNTIENLPDNVAIISPETDYPDGSVQFCGRPKTTVLTMLLGSLHLYNSRKNTTEANKKGIFKSYNIIGAAFMIKRDVFEKVGFFNEYYFFSPEDIALSTNLNRMGYECWVNADAKIIHYEGLTGKSSGGVSLVQTATKPAAAKGRVYFYAGERTNGILYNFLCVWELLIGLLQFLYHWLKGFNDARPNYETNLSRGILNSCLSMLDNRSPKETFLFFYDKIK